MGESIMVAALTVVLVHLTVMTTWNWITLRDKRSAWQATVAGLNLVDSKMDRIDRLVKDVKTYLARAEEERAIAVATVKPVAEMTLKEVSETVRPAVEEIKVLTTEHKDYSHESTHRLAGSLQTLSNQLTEALVHLRQITGGSRDARR